jgi:hypothetical protein
MVYTPRYLGYEEFCQKENTRNIVHYTFKEPTVAVSGISIKSSGTLKELILSFTE